MFLVVVLFASCTQEQTSVQIQNDSSHITLYDVQIHTYMQNRMVETVSCGTALPNTLLPIYFVETQSEEANVSFYVINNGIQSERKYTVYKQSIRTGMLNTIHINNTTLIE